VGKEKSSLNYQFPLFDGGDPLVDQAIAGLFGFFAQPIGTAPGNFKVAV